jgi:hypothetical protein
MNRIYFSFLMVLFTAFSLSSAHSIEIGRMTYQVEEYAAVQDILEQMAGQHPDSIVANLIAMDLIKENALISPASNESAQNARLAEQAKMNLKNRIIENGSSGGNLSNDQIQEEAQLLGVSEEELCLWEREAYKRRQNMFPNLEHSLAACDNLNPLVDLAGPSVLVILDADDTTIARNIANRFAPLQDTTVGNIHKMRQKGSQVLILTSRSFDTIDEVVRRFEEAGINLAQDNTGLFQGHLAQKIEPNGTRSNAGSWQAIVAASGGFTKGEVLSSLIELSPNFFANIKTIVFADDAEDNVRNVHEALQNSRFNSRVFHFTNTDHLQALHAPGRVYEIAIEPVLLAECPLCFEKVEHLNETRCHSSICLGCIQKYCSELVKDEGFKCNEEFNFDIICPACRKPECKFTMTKKTAKELLGERYENLKYRESRNASGIKSCPVEGCKGFYMADDIKDMGKKGYKFLNCPTCHGNICVSCESTYLYGRHQCNTSKILKIEFNESIKPCPNPDCKNVIEKNEGCLTMVCGGNPDNPAQAIMGGGCGAVWCWECGAWMHGVPGKRQSLHNPASQIYSAKTKVRCEHGGLNAFNCARQAQAWWKNE